MASPDIDIQKNRAHCTTRMAHFARQSLRSPIVGSLPNGVYVCVDDRQGQQDPFISNECRKLTLLWQGPIYLLFTKHVSMTSIFPLQEPKFHDDIWLPF